MDDGMRVVEQCSHRTIGEWNELYAERDRLERLWKSAELQAEKTDDAYVIAVEQLRGAVEEVERLRRVVCTCNAYEINFGEGSPIAHRSACPAVPPTPRGQ